MTPTPAVLHAARSIPSAPLSRHSSFALGAAALDRQLGGGLARGALHEIYALSGAAAPAATGFAIGAAVRAAGRGKLVWVRHTMLDAELGGLHANGCHGLGLDPSRLLMVRAQSVAAALRAGGEAVRCAALGAVLVDLWGDTRLFDLGTSRRLALAAERSGVPVLVVRAMAAPVPSAATTRWSVAPLPSRAFAANAPGLPAFEVTLLRHRGGVAGRQWQLEWDHERECFDERQAADRSAGAPLSRAVAATAADRPVAPRAATQRRRSA